LRPITSTVEGCLKIRDEIERAARMKIRGLIGNANLIDETGEDVIYSGYRFVQKLADASNLPLEFVTVAREILPGIDVNRFSCPVLPIVRQLVPPWLKAGEF
jgi:hypothetical protein